MKRTKKLMILATIISIAAILCSCQSEKKVEDDFYETVNAQWMKENENFSGFSYGAVEEQKDKVTILLDNYLMELAKKQDVQADALNEIEQKAVIYYEQATDIEKRNELGALPIQEMLEEVERVSDLDGLVALYKDERMSFFNTLYGFQVVKDPSDGTYQVSVYPKTICGKYGMLTEKQFADYEDLIVQEAVLAGYEKGRAKEIAEHALTIERRMLALDYYHLMDYSRYGNRGMEAVLSNLPLEEIAKAQGYMEDRVTLSCSNAHLKLLQELFIEENTEVLKDYYIAAIIIKSAPYLNEEMADNYEKAVNTLMGSSASEANTYEGYQVVETAMEDFLAEYYMEEYVGKEMEQEVLDMTQEIRGQFKEKIKAADWMSEKTKAYAVKKLESMKLYVGLPEKRHDYSTLLVKSYEEGGNLVENIVNAYVHDCDFQKEFLKEESEQVYYFHALEVNATYAMTYNSFAIHAAIITLNDCNQNTEYEEKLATLGMIIAHEISHGFDGIGSNYTAEGKYQNWWVAEDKAAYRKRINKVKHYFDGMEVEKGLTLAGERVMDEAYADLSAMSVCMNLLNQRENSNYERFFEAYAKREKAVQTKEYLVYLVNNDGHLPGKIRVNHIVNQMDEFYETYEIGEDGELYVKEEERLQVWE